MTGHESPCYFARRSPTDSPPDPTAALEGRLFVTDESLVCGPTGDAATEDGYRSTVDDYSGSTLRAFGLHSPQQFDLDTARRRSGSVEIPFGSITDVSVTSWSGSELPGAEATYGVRVHTPALDGNELLVQLGTGPRNRGNGERRHHALADALGSAAPDSATAARAASGEDAEPTAARDTVDGQPTAAPGADAESTVAADEGVSSASPDDGTATASDTYGEGDGTGSATSTRETTDASSTGTGNVPFGDRALRFLTFCVLAVIATPTMGLLGWDQSIAFWVAYLSFPTPMGVLGSWVLLTASTDGTGYLVLTYGAGLLVPLGVMADALHVRGRSEWTPNVVLYGLGAATIWFVAIPLYLYRRRTAGSTATPG